jgi:hypothetical protein
VCVNLSFNASILLIWLFFFLRGGPIYVQVLDISTADSSMSEHVLSSSNLSVYKFIVRFSLFSIGINDHGEVLYKMHALTTYYCYRKSQRWRLRWLTLDAKNATRKSREYCVLSLVSLSFFLFKNSARFELFLLPKEVTKFCGFDDVN